MEKTKFRANGAGELLPLGDVGEFEFQDDDRNMRVLKK